MNNPGNGAAGGAAGGAGTEFRILGPVDVLDTGTGRRTVPSGAKQRALLAVLVIEAGRTLPVERLADELWAEEGRTPHNAANAAQAHVARLRRILRTHDRAAGADGEWISTEPAGYRLRLGGATTDAERFCRLSAEGRASTAADPQRAARLLQCALSLWRGPALQDCRTGPLRAAEADRLEEHRLTALEALYEARLRTARHEGVTGELERLSEQYPLRERFYDLLMVALHRAGRTDEALTVYERARRRLASDLGVQPGPALHRRLQAMLRNDPPPPTPPTPPRGEEIARIGLRLQELSAELRSLAGRFDALSAHESTPPGPRLPPHPRP